MHYTTPSLIISTMSYLAVGRSVTACDKLSSRDGNVCDPFLPKNFYSKKKKKKKD